MLLVTRIKFTVTLETSNSTKYRGELLLVLSLELLDGKVDEAVIEILTTELGITRDGRDIEETTKVPPLTLKMSTLCYGLVRERVRGFVKGVGRGERNGASTQSECICVCMLVRVGSLWVWAWLEFEIVSRGLLVCVCFSGDEEGNKGVDRYLRGFGYTGEVLVRKRSSR